MVVDVLLVLCGKVDLDMVDVLGVFLYVDLW